VSRDPVPTSRCSFIDDFCKLSLQAPLPLQLNFVLALPRDLFLVGCCICLKVNAAPTSFVVPLRRETIPKKVANADRCHSPSVISSKTLQGRKNHYCVMFRSRLLWSHFFWRVFVSPSMGSPFIELSPLDGLFDSVSREFLNPLGWITFSSFPRNSRAGLKTFPPLRNNGFLQCSFHFMVEAGYGVVETSLCQ